MFCILCILRMTLIYYQRLHKTYSLWLYDQRLHPVQMLVINWCAECKILRFPWQWLKEAFYSVLMFQRSLLLSSSGSWTSYSGYPNLPWWKRLQDPWKHWFTSIRLQATPYQETSIFTLSMKLKWLFIYLSGICRRIRCHFVQTQQRHWQKVYFAVSKTSTVRSDRDTTNFRHHSPSRADTSHSGSQNFPMLHATHDFVNVFVSACLRDKAGFS